MHVLLTGSTGYIGRRLKIKLLDDPRVNLRLFVRNRRKITPAITNKRKTEIVEGDTFSREALDRALHNIDVAYYLVHSMGSRGDFEALDRVSAQNFLESCIANRVKRIIYLGGLGLKHDSSRHLKSRIETGEILSSRPDAIQTIWFRAGVIIGSGGASFEIIRHLVQKVPIIIASRWMRTITQPISDIDVLRYLDGARHIKFSKNLIIDIGSERISYADMVRATAAVMGLKRSIVPFPFFWPRFAAFWLMLFTPVPYSITLPLIEGLRFETVLQNQSARRYFPDIVPIPFVDAVRNAMVEVENDQVISRWSDSCAYEKCDIREHGDLSRAIFTDRRVRRLGNVSRQRVFASIQAIGGENGWFSYNFLWGIRGFIDKIIGGYGTSRGRRNRRNLRIGDSIDFWKVVDLQKNRRLLLYSQMRRLPGRGWLEFMIDDERLMQTAYFEPRGLWGRLYWYAMHPFHQLLFADMAGQIIRRARDSAG